MHLLFNPGLLLATFAGLTTAQNCPYLGPAYPAPASIDAPAFVSASTAFDKALADALASGKIPGAATSYAIQVYSPVSKKPIYASYHTPTTISNRTRTTAVGPDTVFRVHSISKLITVYTILAKLGEKYWDEPVAKYVPEFARLQGGNPAYDADWQEITLGSLASLMSGIGRDYALGDFSVGRNPSEAPGFRGLLGSETVKCGAGDFRPCTRAEALQGVLTVFPFSTSFNTPNYSNMAFQLLAYAVENITGTPFPELVKTQLIEPLNLKRTYLSNPGNLTTDAAITAGWDNDFGDEAPTAGYYQSASDLSTLGSSILSSTLLPAKLTRKWLKPLTHTSSLLTSIGRPWEILRTRVSVNPSGGSKTTRIVDVYTKQGGGQTYTSLIALSPAHNIGVSILVAHELGSSAFKTIKSLTLDIWLAAAEQAARDAAGAAYAGTYTLGGSSTAELGLHPDEPGLYLSKLVSNGTDILEFAGKLGGYQGKLGAWLYPMGLVGRAFSGTEVAFRAAFGVVGVAADENCASWAEVDRLRYGGYPGDLAIFDVGGRAGQVTVSGVKFPMLNERSYRKAA